MDYVYATLLPRLSTHVIKTKGLTKWKTIILSKDYNDIRSTKVIMISSLRVIDKFSHMEENFKRNYGTQCASWKISFFCMLVVIRSLLSFCCPATSVHCYFKLSFDFKAIYELQKYFFVVTNIAP